METAQHISQLMDFHKRNKYLLMLHSQVKLKEMGRLVATSKRGCSKNPNPLTHKSFKAKI